MTAKKLENDLKAPEEREASAVEKLRQSETSKDTEVIRLKNELIAEHEAELQQARADFEAKLQQSMADNAISIQRIVGELERLETLTEKLNKDLKTSEEREASLAEKLRQSETQKTRLLQG